MRSQAILADSGMAARGKEIVFQTALDHPPAEEALESDHAANASELECHGWRHSSPRNEVDGRQEEGNTDDSPP